MSITSLRPKRSVFTISHALLSSATQGPVSLPSTINRRSVWPSMIEIFSMGPFRNVGTQARRLPNLQHAKCKDCNAGFHQLVSRVEIVESVSDLRVPARIESIQKAGAQAVEPGPAWQESRAGVKEESQLKGRLLVLAPGGESRYRALTSCCHSFG